MIKKVSFKNLKFLPASHEDFKNPRVYKKVLFKKSDFTPEVKIQMINWARLPKKRSFSLHYHQDMDEVFIILSGKARIRVGKEEEVLEKGDAILVPTGQVHSMENLVNKDIDYIVIGLSLGKRGKTIVVDDS